MIPIKRDTILVQPSDIKPTSKDFSVIGTFNPAAARLPNGDIILYVRVAEKLLKDEDEKYFYAPRCSGETSCKMELDKFSRKDAQSKSDVDVIFSDGTKRLLFISHLRKVILDKTGFKVKSIDNNPTFSGLKDNGELGIEDPRIVKLGDKYAMTYVSLSLEGNVSDSLALSSDCINWERKGTIFPEQNKDLVLFPEMIGGNYYIFNRPEGGFEFTPPHIWMATSKDLMNWGNNKPLILSKKESWDYHRVGAGAPPIRTEKGWLLLYHGVVDHIVANKISNKFLSQDDSTVYSTYEVGAALFDLKNPRKLIAKAPEPIISPNEKYEREGFTRNVIFPTGLIHDEEKRELLLFSGGADTVTSIKKFSLDDVFDSMKSV